MEKLVSLSFLFRKALDGGWGNYGAAEAEEGNQFLQVLLGHNKLPLGLLGKIVGTQL